MKVMLDTDSCIFLINRRPGMTPQSPLHDCCISAIVLGELEYGILKSARPDANRDRLQNFLSSVAVLEVGEAESLAYAEIRLALQQQLIGRNDMWIAAHALALELPLVTNNTREFSRVPSLRIDTWMERGD